MAIHYYLIDRNEGNFDQNNYSLIIIQYFYWEIFTNKNLITQAYFNLGAVLMFDHLTFDSVLPFKGKIYIHFSFEGNKGSYKFEPNKLRFSGRG